MSHQQEENSYYSKSSVRTNVLWIGFFGGLLASLFGIAAHYVHFIEFSPNFILTSWSNQSWMNAWQGLLITVLLFALLSIALAFLYYVVCKKMNGMLVYMLFGVFCWALLLFVCNPLFRDLPALSTLSADSIITSICIFVVYGVFVGYSISFDHQEYSREQKNQQSSS